MDKLRFYKIEERYWYADIPEWKGNKSELAMVAGADKLLNRLSKGKDEVTLQFSKKPFIGCKKLKFGFKTPVNGAVYFSRGFPLWLCDVTLFVLGEFPKRIFYKTIK